MPIYEFRCEDCGHVMEALRRMGQGPEGLSCPECGSENLVQMFSSFASSGGAGSSGGSSGGSCGSFG